jgi:hypothetical protein
LENATCANFFLRTAFALISANVCSPYKLAPICAIKAAKVTKYKNLAPPQKRKFREKGASFILEGAQDFYI